MGFTLLLEALTSDLLHDGIKCFCNPPCGRIRGSLACDVPSSDLRHGLHHGLAELLGHAICPKVVGYLQVRAKVRVRVSVDTRISLGLTPGLRVCLVLGLAMSSQGQFS